jgi:hypothetical protein
LVIASSIGSESSTLRREAIIAVFGGFHLGGVVGLDQSRAPFSNAWHSQQ